MLNQAFNKEKIRADFESDGFAFIEKFFDEDEMQAIDRHLDEYIRTVVPNLPPDRVFLESSAAVAVGGGCGGARKIKSLNRMDKESDYFGVFKQNPQFKSLVAGIFRVGPEDLVAETLQFFGKPAFEGSETPWHQDNGFQYYEPPESLMIWLALADVDEEVGCVCFARGSHKLAVVKHVPSGVLGFSQTVGTPPPDTKVFPEVKATMRRRRRRRRRPSSLQYFSPERRK